MFDGDPRAVWLNPTASIGMIRRLAQDRMFPATLDGIGAVLAAAGDRDKADYVLFTGRERDRANVCELGGFIAPGCLWLFSL